MKTLPLFAILSLSITVSSCVAEAILGLGIMGLVDPAEVSLPGYNNSDVDVWFSHYVPNMENPTSEVRVYNDQRAWYYTTQFVKVEAGSAAAVFISETYN